MKALCAFMAAISLLFSCSDSSFTSGGDSKKGNPEPKEPPSSDMRDFKKFNDTNPPPKACQQRKIENYNFVIVFDATRSQLKTDPDNVRGAGAQVFTERLLELSSQTSNVNFGISFIRFGDVASAYGSPNPWIQMTQQNYKAVLDGIQFATVDPRSYKTIFSPAIELAGKLLEGASGDAQNSRNYVVFLTDGQPYSLFERSEDIIAAVKTHIISQQAALIAIASGREDKIEAEDEQLVQSMALPVDGTQIDPHHKGFYKRASQAEDLRGIWDQTFTDLFNQSCLDQVVKQTPSKL